jgi:hypothetical protein
MAHPHTEYKIPNLTFQDLVMLDTKVGILNSFQALDVKVSKSLRKAELADMLATVFEEKPFYIINHLSESDQSLLSKLIACKQDECVVVPASDQPTGLQRHHLVVTVVDGDKWKLYMPDGIRNHIDKCAMQDLSVYPGMQEWKDTLEKLNKLQNRIEADVKYDPTLLPIQLLPRFIQQLRCELDDLQKLEKQMKRLESRIKQYNVDFAPIYASIHESYRQGENKLQIMGMFKWA